MNCIEYVTIRQFLRLKILYVNTGEIRVFMSIQKLGIKINKHCARYIKTHGKLPALHNIPLGAGKKRFCISQKTSEFLITDQEIKLLSQNGEELSSLLFYKENDCVNILDMVSSKSGCGYGTVLIQKFMDLYKDSKIKAAACWERFVSSKPPHKFYMQNGFTPIDKKAEQVLREWIVKGSNPKNFPVEYELCEMMKIPT